MACTRSAKTNDGAVSSNVGTDDVSVKSYESRLMPLVC